MRRTCISGGRLTSPGRPIFPIAGWGIGLAANAWDVYGRRPISEAEIRPGDGSPAQLSRRPAQDRSPYHPPVWCRGFAGSHSAGSDHAA